eukprot:TRINITY_DN6053_c0_g3_i1.p1 TRINITY_DN6053_c0_g3~~TRINITY_DN6053_c0_g3_i1.p1  ORF type:complete len:839 (-),score=131.55 TRINITY_DN6053_c0_g3_i1:229-2745(-)
MLGVHAYSPSRKRTRSRSPGNNRSSLVDNKRSRYSERDRSPFEKDRYKETDRGRDSHRAYERDRERIVRFKDEKEVDRLKERDRDRDRVREREERDRSGKQDRNKKNERNKDREREGDKRREGGVSRRKEEGQLVEDDSEEEYYRFNRNLEGRDVDSFRNRALGSPVYEGEVNLVPKLKREPLSLEELLKKRQQQQQLEAKPVFVPKEKRVQNGTDEINKEGNVDNKQISFDDKQLVPPHLSRNLQQAGVEDERKQWQDERERQKQLELIKEQYLGKPREKRRIMKASEKFKFNFDWDTVDDTSKDLNPIYNQLHDSALLFGRGMRAGVDRREQKKIAAKHERVLLARQRESYGLSETREDRRRDRKRAEAADKYDAYDMKVDRHWKHKRREEMTERDWRIFREDYNIAFKGHSPCLPIRNWGEADLEDPIIKAVDRLGYKEPQPIQMAAIPLGLQQRDVIGIAETGSGKTAAFVVPMLSYIIKQPPMTEERSAEGPYAVVLAPTRELAQQIEEETIKLATYTRFKVTSVVGGQSIEEQGVAIRKGCEIIIATPGRLLDCLQSRYAVLNQCNYVVLDEADRMIDMGFEQQVNAVLDAMPSSNLKPENEALEEADRVYRTTYMFSATMPPSVERLAKKYLRRPVVVTIGSAGRATDNVTQRVVMIKESEKAQRLKDELEYVDEKKAIVFVNTQKKCDAVYRLLEDEDYNCTILHGGKTQDQREVSIKGFRDGTFNILIATDVAGRGIDVPNVALVVNYDMAGSVEMYTHRIGRTGRAGKKGTAITFLTLQDSDTFFELKKLLEECNAQVPPELARHEAAKVKPGSFEALPKRAETLYVK